jgi:hypothetical protein
VVSDRRRDTDHHQLDTHLAGEYRSVVLHVAVPLAIGTASAILEWELAGLSAQPPGVGASDFAGAVLEAEAL